MGSDSTDQSNHSTTYCIECGTELPDSASFCPDCGEEVSDNSDLIDSGSNSEKQHPDPEKAASKAEGAMKAEFLGQTKAPKTFLGGMRSEGSRMLFDDPLITYLESDEQIQYLLHHPANGLRIIELDGEERIPHHDAGSATGRRFLMITDSRLIYVAAYKGEDIVRTFDYESIENVSMEGAFFSSPTMDFEISDGTTYRFANTGTTANLTDLSNAVEYIQNQIK